MNTSWETGTDVRLRSWGERIEEGESMGLEIEISIADRLEAILQLRAVQDLAVVPRMYAV